MNRIDQLFEKKKSGVLNVYFTAGYPQLNDTMTIAKALQEAGADILEIGVPFSDPMADGPTIQRSSEIALDNGMSTNKLFEQLKDLRKHINIPVLLMGYINPVLKYGLDDFCDKCGEVGIDGLIFPDLPYFEFDTIYRPAFERNKLSNVFLVTPQTSNERLKQIDGVGSGFIYVVSTASTTGNKSKSTGNQTEYFKRVQSADLKNPTLIGFNIKDKETFNNACQYANGAIIGSAFVNKMTEAKDLAKEAKEFVRSILD